jgi:hypothetical protein
VWPDIAAEIDSDVERESELSEARHRWLRVMNAFAVEMEQGLRNNLDSARITFWGLCHGLGLAIVDGITLIERADQLGCTRQAISKVATNFLAGQGLPPSFNGKSEDSRQTYRDARYDSIRRANGKAARRFKTPPHPRQMTNCSKASRRTN